jgi:uncharacterized integral membrane protein
MQLAIVIFMIFGVIISFFAVLNTEAVTLNYYFGQINTSVALLVLVAAVFGALTVSLVGLIKQVRTGFAIWDYRNKLQHLQKEVEALREEKRALSDDLAYVNAECEMALRQKEAELDECRESTVETTVETTVDEAAVTAEEKQKDER